MNTINFSALYALLKKIPKLFIGLALCAFGITLMLTANIGVNPWGTFTYGLVNVTGLSFGKLSQLIGLTIIVGTLFMKIYPGVGTLFNMYFIGFFIDTFKSSGFLVQPDNFLIQIVMCLVGLVILSFGIYLYLSCGLGAGPRDGLMIALIRITGKSVTLIKPVLEITVIILGILLGGPLGVGTILVAVLGGKILDAIFKLMKYDPKENTHQNLVDLAWILFPREDVKQSA